MQFTYVCSLMGDYVFHGHTIIGCINNLYDIYKIREKIKDEYGIEFEKLASIFNSSGCLCYTNITDDRDVYLVVERTYFI